MDFSKVPDAVETDEEDTRKSKRPRKGAKNKQELCEAYELVEEGLKLISESSAKATINVVFVHGIDGGAVTTFFNDDKGSEVTYWPRHLAENNGACCVWTLRYDEKKFGGFFAKPGTTGILDKSAWFADQLYLKNVHKRPIVFVCHSLGGILVKQMLQLSWYASKKWLPIWASTQAVMFLATPHSGSDVASFASRLPGASTMHKELVRGSPPLLYLGRWYQIYAPKQNIETIVYAEGKRVLGLAKVVTPESADANVAGSPVIRLAEYDHIAICKPKQPGSTVYCALSKCLEKIKTDVKGRITKANDQIKVYNEGLESLLEIFARVKAVEGYWWERFESGGKPYLCFMEIKPDRASNSLVLGGETFDKNGSWVIEWYTQMARVDVDDTPGNRLVLKYAWYVLSQDMTNELNNEFGYGIFRFPGKVDGDGHQLQKASGFYWNGNEKHQKCERRATELRRIEDDNIVNTMKEKGKRNEQKKIVLDVLKKWSN